ncbi:H-type lectin domain-containing protein [Streptomyces sp. NBC_01433]|uniref:H-type lectin domain-containing protein n=1 Tax=unclassified Streptomyces TaxID=2593676 RepID=UPI002259D7BD|nr:H-type lectin domain-containing protein [Streptomyces sp. NBC_01433]MCX4676688.1 H-type lectin domain-containing protein [Streptomyces sp. NBC_01433]
MSTDDYGQGVTVAELLDAPNAETLAKNLANGIVARSVLVFASAAARSAALLGAAAPTDGMHTYLKDTQRLYEYQGTVWRQVSSLTQQGAVSMNWSNANQASVSVTFPFAFPSAPLVFVNLATGTGAVSRWSARAYSIGTSSFTILLYAPDPAILTSGSSIPVQWFASLT